MAKIISIWFKTENKDFFSRIRNKNKACNIDLFPEQYYHDDQSGEVQYNEDYSSQYTRLAPPPAHQEPRPPQYRERIKEEPGLDMSSWTQVRSVGSVSGQIHPIYICT